MQTTATATDIPPAMVRHRLRQFWSTTRKNYLTVTSLGILSIAVLLLITLRTVWPATVLATYGFDDKVAVALFSAICVGLSVALIVHHVLVYVKTGQKRRLEVIKGFYSGPLVADYLEQFWSGRDDVKSVVRKYRANTLDESIFGLFDRILEADFGMGHYRFPLGILVAVASFVMFFTFTGSLALAVQMADLDYAFPVPLNIKVDLVSIAAMFGAYTWVASDVIGRNHHGALHASNLSWYALRLLIAVPLGQAISVFAGTGTDSGTGALGAGYAALLAFLISMFSLERITQILGGLTNRVLAIPAAAPEERDDLLIKLPGVDERTAQLIGSEGITTIAQLVSADPVRTSIRTSLGFDFVLNLIDAAILWRYVDGKLAQFREFGLTGASCVILYNDGLAKRIAEAKADFEKAKDALTKADEAQRLAKDELQEAARRRASAQLSVQEAANNATPEQNAELNSANDAYAHAEAVLGSARDERDAAVNKLLEKSAVVTNAVAQHADIDVAVAFGSLVSDLAAATEMKPSGLENIFDNIRRDEYAQFLHRLLR